jgi:hypothetical protein
MRSPYCLYVYLHAPPQFLKVESGPVYITLGKAAEKTLPPTLSMQSTSYKRKVRINLSQNFLFLYSLLFHPEDGSSSF